MGALDFLGANALVDIGFISFYSQILFFVSLACYFGLFIFMPWARFGVLAISIIQGVSSPVYGLSVQSGYDGMFGYFVVLGNGLIIAVAYFTDVRRLFSKGAL